MPALSELRKVLATIDKTDWVIAHRAFLKIPHDTPDVNTYEQLVLAIWEWLAHLGITTDSQRRGLLTRMEPALRLLAEKIDQESSHAELHPRRALPVFILMIEEYRMATWSLSQTNKFWHLLDETFCPASEAPEPPVTRVTCDVTALYLRTQRRLQRVTTPI